MKPFQAFESGRRTQKVVFSSLEAFKNEVSRIWERAFEERVWLKRVQALSEGSQGSSLFRTFRRSKKLLKKNTPKALEVLKREKRTRVKFILKCDMERTSMATGEVIREEAAFSSRVEENLQGNDERELWREMTGESFENMANFQRIGSNWGFSRVIQAELHFIGFDPLRAGTFKDLPSALKNEKAIIHMENTDNKCFKWCFTRAMNPVSRTQRGSQIG